MSQQWYKGPEREDATGMSLVLAYLGMAMLGAIVGMLAVLGLYYFFHAGGSAGVAARL